jgi:hypothetical protein
MLFVVNIAILLAIFRHALYLLRSVCSFVTWGREFLDSAGTREIYNCRDSNSRNTVSGLEHETLTAPSYNLSALAGCEWWDRYT